MRTQYSNRRTSSLPLFGVLLFVLLATIAVFAVDTFTGGWIRSYVRTMSSLAWRATAATVTTVDQSGVLRSRTSLVQENDALKQEIIRRDEETARFRALEDENAALQDMVHLVQAHHDGISARVLSSFLVSPYGTFIIQAGKSDGLATGNAVLSPGGFIIGVVSDADAHSSTVQELFAPGNTVQLIAENVAFSADGRGGGNARAEIPRDAKVALGDVVKAHEYAGLPAGVIGSIESASSSATQTLFIRLPVNLDTLTFVYVIPK